MTELIQRLDRTIFDVHVACFQHAGAWLPRVAAVAPVTAFPIHGFAHPGTLVRAAGFAQWCRARRIAVLQACDFYANTFALPAAAFAGVPVRVGSRRELNPDKSAGQIALQRQAYRFAHKIVANSRAAARQLASEGIAADRIQIIPNGVNAGAGYAAVSRTGPVTTILTVANLRAEKAHEVLLAAAAELRPRYPYLRYRIAGDGPRLAELKALASSLGLDGTVRFLGHREEVPALLHDADVFVLPSRSEAFPNGAIEAMAAGLPVVASRVGGLLDLIDDGRTGLLVSPDDPAALAGAIESLVLSPARAELLGAAAREEVMRRYSFERMVRGFEDLFLSQLHGAEAPGRHARPRVSSRAA
jgi:glycosyltransferase involved in cell wall biosynthesis